MNIATMVMGALKGYLWQAKSIDINNNPNHLVSLRSRNPSKSLKILTSCRKSPTCSVDMDFQSLPTQQNDVLGI